jgi:hypothetical protein
MGPTNWVVPLIFEELSAESGYYQLEIQGLNDYWKSHMASLNHVIGICYFVYDIGSEAPYYPLKMFWRSEDDTIAINL